VSKQDYKADLHTYLAYAPQSFGLDWELTTEVRFHPVRRFRFDFCWTVPKIAIEYDGITGPGHNSLNGMLRDSEKINLAQALGWRVFRANTPSLRDSSFYTLMNAVLADEAERRAA